MLAYFCLFSKYYRNNKKQFFKTVENILLWDYNNSMEVWHFSDNKEQCDYLFDLVKNGEKTATSYLFCGEDFLRELNCVSQICNWDNTEKLLVKTTRIYKCKFCEIDKQHAQKEGEGDKSLEYWKAVHKDFFEEECQKIEKTFCEDTEIICEEFKVINK